MAIVILLSQTRYVGTDSQMDLWVSSGGTVGRTLAFDTQILMLFPPFLVSTYQLTVSCIEKDESKVKEACNGPLLK